MTGLVALALGIGLASGARSAPPAGNERRAVDADAPEGCLRPARPERSEFWRDVACTDVVDAQPRSRSALARQLVRRLRLLLLSVRDEGPPPDRTLLLGLALRAHELDPGNPIAAFELGRLLADGEGTPADWEMALDVLARAARLAPTALDADVAFERAIALTRLHRFAEAASEYERALAALVDPDAGAAHVVRANLAEVTMLSGDLERAVLHFERAREGAARAGDARGAALALWGLAVAVDRLGEHEDALRHAADAIDQVDGGMAVLRSPGVFFEPPHELHWYEALGYEARALRAASAAERDRARARALASWQAFLEEGGGSGPWADIARARRRALEETR